MEKLFRTMCIQIPDHEKMQILQQNMRVDYKRQMTFIPIQDLETLVAAGQKLDALNFSAYNKVFGTEKSVHAVEQNASRNRQKSFQPQPQPSNRPAGSFKEPSNNQNKNNRNPPFHPQSKPTNVTPHPTQPSQKSSSTPSASNSEVKSPVPGPSGHAGPSKSSITLEQVVSGHKPPGPNTCFNCGTPGHHVVMCRQPRRLFCDNCGLHGFPTGFCPYCLKNGPRANENRRSPNQGA
nr:uncharacterized protein LOC115268856 [Aedes albopictus]